MNFLSEKDFLYHLYRKVRPPGFEPGSSAFRPTWWVGRLMSYQTRLRPLRTLSNVVTVFISFVEMKLSVHAYQSDTVDLYGNLFVATLHINLKTISTKMQTKIVMLNQ